jgi:hypothetical protein
MVKRRTESERGWRMDWRVQVEEGRDSKQEEQEKRTGKGKKGGL